jgi:hypothetical protein
VALGHKRVHREDEPPVGIAPLVVEGEELIGDAFQDIRGPLVQDGVCTRNPTGSPARIELPVTVGCISSVDLCLLAPSALSPPDGGRYHCSCGQCKEGNRSCAHALAVCP